MNIKPTSGEHQGLALVNPRARCKAGRVGMTASPDRDRNGRQVKEFQVKKNQYKVGDKVYLASPDGTDIRAGLGYGVVGTVVDVGDTLVGVDWEVVEPTPNPFRHDCGGKARKHHGWTVIHRQLAYVDKPKAARPTKVWTYKNETKKRANYLTLNKPMGGIYVQSPDRIHDVHVFFGTDGRVSITVWGRKRQVEVAVDNTCDLQVSRF